METEFKLGVKVKAKLTGHIGIVYGHARFLHSVDAYYVRARGLDNNGNIFPSYSYEAGDIERLEDQDVPE
jgi:hypothetical protein